VTAAQNRFAIGKLDRWPIHDNSEEFDEVDHHLLTSLRPDLWNCEMSTFNRVAETEIFDLSFFERPLLAASSTDRCNTFSELLSRRLIEQGLSRPFIELPCDGTELGLTVQGQIGATRKILAQQSVGVFV
jgi:hypothetical protein